MNGSNSNRHLSYFKVNNFKNLRSTELHNIGLFNIIIGDNNVGKTSLLEALLFDKDAFVFNENLGDALLEKGLIAKENDIKDLSVRSNYVRFFINQAAAKQEFDLSFKINQSDEIYTQKVTLHNKLVSGLKNQWSNSFIFTHDNQTIQSTCNYPPEMTEMFDSYNLLSDNSLFDDLVDYYERTVQKNLATKKDFLNALRLFIPNIENIEVRHAKDEFKYPHLIFFTSDSPNPFPINVLGQGAVKYLKLLMGLSAFKNYRLMIDEIDNGIHYQKQKEFIKNIILTALTTNTQIFCTTHNLECLKAIASAFNTIELVPHQHIFSCYSLAKNKSEDIKSFYYNFENFSHSIENNIELR